MIRSSACQPWQPDLPGHAGDRGDLLSYTTPRDTIMLAVRLPQAKALHSLQTRYAISASCPAHAGGSLRHRPSRCWDAIGWARTIMQICALGSALDQAPAESARPSNTNGLYF